MLQDSILIRFESIAPMITPTSSHDILHHIYRSWYMKWYIFITCYHHLTMTFCTLTQIQRDSLLIKASTNITEGYIKSSSTSSNGEVSPEFCRIMKEVDNILSHLNEKELAVMWCYSMLKKLTSGMSHFLFFFFKFIK